MALSYGGMFQGWFDDLAMGSVDYLLGQVTICSCRPDYSSPGDACVNGHSKEVPLPTSTKIGSINDINLWYDFRVNSLTPVVLDYSIKLVDFKLISTIIIRSIFCEMAIRWMLQYLTDDQSPLVQVMAWCCQATSHYLSQCWPRSLLPYDVTRLQWVKSGSNNTHYRFVHLYWCL